jgi:hypothetical protein
MPTTIHNDADQLSWLDALNSFQTRDAHNCRHSCCGMLSLLSADTEQNSTTPGTIVIKLTRQKSCCNHPLLARPHAKSKPFFAGMNLFTSARSCEAVTLV